MATWTALKGSFELRAAKVAQDVHLDNGFRAEGIVSFRDVRVDHEFILKEIKSADKMILDLSFAKIASLLNDSQSWPERGNLSLQGFVYDVIDKDAKSDASTQVQWLDRQSRLEFLSQPYEQLAVVLRNMGLQEESVKVMIAKNEDHGRYAKGWDWWWYNVFGKVIGYGYRPWDALWPSLFFVGIGTVLFWRGFRSKILMPKDEKTYEAYKKDQPTESYPSFNCFIYSLETFVPLVKLGINEYWVPNSNLGDDVIFLVREFALRFAFGAYATKPVRDEFAPLKASGQLATRNPFKVGGLLRWYLWFHILVGWILTTLLLGGLTGLLKT
jgi:hypothetical protein